MNVKVRPSNIEGVISAPPSKSFAHRMMICAALSNGESTICGITQSEDILATLDCISELGAKSLYSKSTLTVTGANGKPNGKIFKCRESGSTLRFFIPILLISGETVKFEGTPRLIERGIGVYENIFKEKGISVEKSSDSITLCGKLSSGEYVLPGNVSSQFVSGLMFALPLLSGDSIIRVLPPVESRGYIDITIAVLKLFGVDIKELENNVFSVQGNAEYKKTVCTAEGDWSNGAALLALNEIGGRVNVSGLNENSLQGDRVCTELFKKLSETNPEIDISLCPDLAPVLFAVAAAKNGGVFTGTRRLRIKESDRAQVMADELKKFGIDVKVEENRVTVFKGQLKTPILPCDSHNDHRIVMAMTLLGLLVGCEIRCAEAINKSYPSFFSEISTLGASFEYEF